MLQVPSAAANFVELEALRWENRKLADAKAVAETQVQNHSMSHRYFMDAIYERRADSTYCKGAKTRDLQVPGH